MYTINIMYSIKQQPLNKQTNKPPKKKYIYNSKKLNKNKKQTKYKQINKNVLIKINTLKNPPNAHPNKKPKHKKITINNIKSKQKTTPLLTLNWCSSRNNQRTLIK